MKEDNLSEYKPIIEKLQDWERTLLNMYYVHNFTQEKNLRILQCLTKCYIEKIKIYKNKNNKRKQIAIIEK